MSLYTQIPETDHLQMVIVLFGDKSDPRHGSHAEGRERVTTNNGYLHQGRSPPEVFQGGRGEVERARGALLKQ